MGLTSLRSWESFGLRICEGWGSLREMGGRAQGLGFGDLGFRGLGSSVCPKP